MKVSIGTKVGQSSHIELKQQIKFAQKWNQQLRCQPFFLLEANINNGDESRMNVYSSLLFIIV